MKFYRVNPQLKSLFNSHSAKNLSAKSLKVLELQNMQHHIITCFSVLTIPIVLKLFSHLAGVRLGIWSLLAQSVRAGAGPVSGA